MLTNIPASNIFFAIAKVSIGSESTDWGNLYGCFTTTGILFTLIKFNWFLDSVAPTITILSIPKLFRNVTPSTISFSSSA